MWHCRAIRKDENDWMRRYKDNEVEDVKPGDRAKITENEVW